VFLVEGNKKADKLFKNLSAFEHLEEGVFILSSFLEGK
jgi:hypothetical protein